MKKLPFVWLLMALALPAVAADTAPMSSKPTITNAQQVSKFDRFDGVWRGSAWILTPQGERIELTQTERVGSLLGGDVKMIEGRGYKKDGELSFNALGIISFDQQTQAFNFRSYTMGRSGDFAIRPTESGFVWEIPAGPATIRYTATVSSDQWHEVGERIVEGQKPMQFFEMTLTRQGESDWPAAGAITPEPISQ